jgi:ribosomal protein S4E
VQVLSGAVANEEYRLLLQAHAAAALAPIMEQGACVVCRVCRIYRVCRVCRVCGQSAGV